MHVVIRETVSDGRPWTVCTVTNQNTGSGFTVNRHGVVRPSVQHESVLRSKQINSLFMFLYVAILTFFMRFNSELF